MALALATDIRSSQLRGPELRWYVNIGTPRAANSPHGWELRGIVDCPKRGSRASAKSSGRDPAAAAQFLPPCANSTDAVSPACLPT